MVRVLASFALLLVLAHANWARHHAEDIRELKLAACEQPVRTDKMASLTAKREFEAKPSHSYELMYGMFLMPLRHQTHLKMLEIGLGCGMSYGAGASARLWRKVLPKAELWEAEVDASCVNKHRDQLQELNIRPLVGPQQDNRTLQAWLAESGGGFDIVVKPQPQRLKFSYNKEALNASFSSFA